MSQRDCIFVDGPADRMRKVEDDPSPTQLVAGSPAREVEAPTDPALPRNDFHYTTHEYTLLGETPAGSLVYAHVGQVR